MSLAERRRCVTYLKTEYEISERHACQAMDLHRSSYRHAGKRDRFDDAYRAVLRLSAEYPCRPCKKSRHQKSEPSFNLGVVWKASETDMFRFVAGRGAQLPNLINLGGLLLPTAPGQFAA